MKKQRMNFFWLIPVVVLGVLASTTILIYTHAQVDVPAKDKDATVVKEGALTEKQKEHSKLFERNKSGKQISELISQQTKTNGSREITITVSAGVPYLAPVGEYKSTSNALAEIAGNSDAIMVGIVKEKNSQVTENGKFIFTDYLFQVESVIKNNSAKSIIPGELATITRPGGKIFQNGFVVTGTDRSYQNLIAGEKYLFFLRYIPATGAYQSFDPEGSFQITGDKVKTLNMDAASRFRDVSDLTTFTADIYAAVSTNLQGQKVEIGGK